MYEDVLIATDGSGVATIAAEQGLSIAADLEATVHVLSVVEVPRGSRRADGHDRRRDDARLYVEELAAEARDRGVPVETAVRDGDPVREVLAYADDVDVDLLVLGTRGRRDVERLLLGSVALAVIRDSTRPVLTVNPSVDAVSRRIDEIAVATDGRPGSSAAISQAIGLAEAYDAELRAVSVVDDSRTRAEAALEGFEQAADAATKAVAVRAADRGVGTVRSVVRGRPADELLAYADAHGVDLLVLGAEGRSGLERLVVGGVSQRVVSAAPTPVLTVRALEDVSLG